MEENKNNLNEDTNTKEQRIDTQNENNKKAPYPNLAVALAILCVIAAVIIIGFAVYAHIVSQDDNCKNSLNNSGIITNNIENPRRSN